MDLLQSVHKEGSRGGVDFKWEDVRSSQHRENYLGHSLMAPVGRWQKGKDLNWYAKAGDAEQTPEEIAAAEKQKRQDEIRKVKEAEEDAMARALGLPVPDRSANTEPLGENRMLSKEVNAALKEALGGDEAEKTARSVQPREHRRERDDRRRRRSRTPERRRRSHSRERDRHHRRHHERRRSRSIEKPRRTESRRYTSPKRSDREQYRRRSRERSRSPYKKRDRSSRSYD